ATLFTGQWADLTLEVICEKASKWGYDGIELPCWGDHFNVQKALKEPGYCKARHELLAKYGLKCWAISNHLAGQLVLDHNGGRTGPRRGARRGGRGGRGGEGRKESSRGGGRKGGQRRPRAGGWGCV